MKKLGVFLVIVLMSLAACSGDREKPVSMGEIEGPSIGVVTDTGGIDDKSFNQGTWEGVLRFVEEKGGKKPRYLQSNSDADYTPNLSAFADEGLDLIIAPGFLFAEALTEVARNYPDQKFLHIDSVVEAPNVASAVFAEEQGSFLVGAAAALKAQEAGMDTVGFLGGMDFGLIQKFEAGFEAGVAAIDPNMTVFIEYVGSFTDSQGGQSLSSIMFDAGAYVIYHAAGGTGNGLIKEARDRRIAGQDVWAIGVDKDQYRDGIYDGTSSAVLTSMVKRVDVAAYSVAEDVMNGTFRGGEVLTFALEDGGVALPEQNPNLSDAILQGVSALEEDIIMGRIEVPTTPKRLR